jgi:hypothetical protein
MSVSVRGDIIDVRVVVERSGRIERALIPESSFARKRVR